MIQNEVLLLGYSPNMISMILDNLSSQGYNNKLWVANNELKEISDLNDIWHPQIEVKRIDEADSNALFKLIELNQLSVFMGVYKSASKSSMYMQFSKLLKQSPNLIHQNTEISQSTKLGIGNMINTGVVIAGHTAIGSYCSINRNSSIGHHTKIQDFCTINPNSTICGGITLEQNVTVGASATIIDGLTIGENSIIGAGSVVVNNIPANSLVMGIPGKVVRSL